MTTQGIPETFCWSKMGTESGEGLDAIIRRKEIERLANGGAFVWGVGNPLGESMALLLKGDRNPLVIFTLMKSKPKLIDEQPGSILIWLTYYDAEGVEQPLPEYSLLTSRGHTESNQRKRSHYALLCTANSPLRHHEQSVLNAAELRNLSTGKPVGYSQVTSVVKRVNNTPEENLYPIGFQASLQREGQVRLASSIKVSNKSLAPVLKAAEQGDIVVWKHEIDNLKSKYSQAAFHRNYNPQLSIAL